MRPSQQIRCRLLLAGVAQVKFCEVANSARSDFTGEPSKLMTGKVDGRARSCRGVIELTGLAADPSKAVAMPIITSRETVACLLTLVIGVKASSALFDLLPCLVKSSN